MSSGRKLIIAGSIVAVLIPFMVTCLLVVQYAVNVPFMDEWESVRLFQKADERALTVADFWQQHNEHRLFFANIIVVAVGSLTHWHLGIQMLLSQLCMLGIAVLIGLYMWRDIRQRPSRIMYLALISALLFSLSQWENWVRGFQFPWFMCTFFGVLAFYLLDARATFSDFRTRFGLAIIACVVSSYSLGGGIFFWIACLVPLIACKKARLYVEVWIAAALACLALYLYKYTFLESSSANVGIEQYAQFFFAYIGTVFTHDQEMAVLFGVILMLLTAVAVWYALRVRCLPLERIALPIGLAVFVVLSDLITTQSRTNVTGAFGAVTSKYATVATLLVVALVLLYMHIGKVKSLAAPLAVAAVLLPLIVGVSLHGKGKMQQMQYGLTNLKLCLNQPQPPVGCMANAHPSPHKVEANLYFLKRKHLAGF